MLCYISQEEEDEERNKSAEHVLMVRKLYDPSANYHLAITDYLLLCSPL